MVRIVAFTRIERMTLRVDQRQVYFGWQLRKGPTVITFMIVCMGLLVVLALLSPVLDTLCASSRRDDALRRLRRPGRMVHR